jgi:hypothetical protein
MTGRAKRTQVKKSILYVRAARMGITITSKISCSTPKCSSSNKVSDQHKLFGMRYEYG